MNLYRTLVAAVSWSHTYRYAALLGFALIHSSFASAQSGHSGGLNLDLTQRAPDLVIVAAQQRGTRRREGRTLVVPLVVTIKNQGTASANAPFKIGVSFAAGSGSTPEGRLVFRPASSLFRRGQVVRIRGLNAGRSQQVIGEVRIHDPHKTVSEERVVYLKAKVDAGTHSPTGAIAETNEGNNWSPVARRLWN